MRALVAILAFLAVFKGGSDACELQAILDSAQHCGDNGNLFSLSKYADYLTTMFQFAENVTSTEEFFDTYSLATIASFFGELEPTIVWLMDSFYTEHLKDRTEDTLLRPFFGNMDDMGLVLSDSLDRHCPIINELKTCMTAQLAENCASADDATSLMDFIDPLLTVHCNGAEAKPDALSWLKDNSAGMTKAFTCALNENFPLNFTFVDFTNHPALKRFDFERLLSECNAEAVGPFMEEYFGSVLGPMFENFTMETFNIMDIVDMDIPGYILSNLRPLGDCFIKKVLPLAETLCSSINVDANIENIAGAIRRLLPMFLPVQTTLKNMLLNPMDVKPFALAGRYMRAVVGLGDVFVGEDWEASCPDSELIYAVGNLAIRRGMKTGHITFGYSGDVISNKLWLIANETVPMLIDWNDNKEYFNDTSSVASDFSNNGIRISQMDTDGFIWYEVYVTHQAVMLAFGNPTGKNWIFGGRASDHMHQMSSGILIKGCSDSGSVKAEIEKLYDDDNSIPMSTCRQKCEAQNIADDLLEMPSSLYKRCAVACVRDGWFLATETTWLRRFDKYARALDQKVINRALNGNGENYGPCSMIGFYSNILEPCLSTDEVQNRIPTFDGIDTLAILKDVGIAEPYGIFSVSAFANDWLTGANARQFPDLGISSDNLTYLVSSTTLRTAMEKHCLLIDPLIDCMKERTPDFCTNHQELINDYMKPLGTRYCQNLDSADGATLKESVFDAMIAARSDDSLTDALSCFLDLTNETHLVFNETKIEMIYQNLLDRCDVGNIMFFVQQLIEDAGDRGVIYAINNALQIMKNPGRCILNVVSSHCPETNIEDTIDKLLPHIQRATGDVLSIDKEYFIPSEVVNYGDRDRVTMWCVGDPHLRPLGQTEFVVCDAPGITNYFTCEHDHSVVLKGRNELVREGSTATVLKEIWLTVHDRAGNPAVSYHVANGDLSESLNDEVNGGNETSVTIDGEITVSITYNDVLGAVIITDAFNGLVIAIAPFRGFYSMVVRGGRSYVDRGYGLIKDGCSEVVDPAAAIQTAVSNRRKRNAGPTQAECEAACQSVPSYLVDSCSFDCVVMEDTTMAQAHETVASMEASVQEEDVKVYTWFPEEESSALNLCTSLSLLIAAILLKYL